MDCQEFHGTGGTNLDIPSTMTTDNGFWITSRYFARLAEKLSVKTVTSAESHPQANGQVEHFNATTITIFMKRLADHQKDWDMFVLPLTYACSVRSTKSLNLSHSVWRLLDYLPDLLSYHAQCRQTSARLINPSSTDYNHPQSACTIAYRGQELHKTTHMIQ